MPCHNIANRCGHAGVERGRWVDRFYYACEDGFVRHAAAAGIA